MVFLFMGLEIIWLEGKILLLGKLIGLVVKCMIDWVCKIMYRERDV